MGELVLTFDTDWCPDFAVGPILELLAKRRIRSTWFVTHESEALEKLRACQDVVEIGIHPNFMPGSTHGPDPTSVTEYCLRMVPNAVSMRTHGLIQSTALLTFIAETTGIRWDASILLPGVDHLRPFNQYFGSRPLRRVPGFWEDDVEMGFPTPRWKADRERLELPGIKMFTFHPIHIHLNSASFGPYRDLKSVATSLTDVSRDQAAAFRNPGEGTATIFGGLLDAMERQGFSRFVRDLPAGDHEGDAHGHSEKS